MKGKQMQVARQKKCHLRLATPPLSARSAERATPSSRMLTYTTSRVTRCVLWLRGPFECCDFHALPATTASSKGALTCSIVSLYMIL